MAAIPRSSERLIERFHLRGTMYERLILNPDGWAHSENLHDSPELSRYAQDVSRAFRLEGWKPPLRRGPAFTWKRKSRSEDPTG